MKRSFYLVSAGTLLIACCYGFARFAYALFTPTLTEEFGLTPTTVGAIGSGGYVGYCVAIAASSALTGVLGARRVAVAAGVVATVGISLVATAPSAGVLAVGIVVAGSSTGIASPPLAAAVGRWVRGDVRDRAQTVVNAGTGAGVVMTAPIALLLVDQWRVAWAVMAAISAAVTVMVARAVPSSGRSGERPVPRRAWRAGTPALVVASLLAGFGSVAVWNFGRTVAGGLGDTTAVVAWTVLGAAGVAGAFSGDAVRRLGLGRAWGVAIALVTVATLAYALYPHVAVTVVVAAGVFGAAYIALTGLLLLWAIRVYPDSPSFGVGLSFLTLAAGQAFGAPAVGALVETYSARTAFLVAAAVGITALAVRPARAPVRCDPSPAAGP